MAVSPSAQQFRRQGGHPPAVALLRFIRGWSQRELAEHAGVSKRTIVSTETGEHTPRLETALAIARALDVDVALILPTTSEATPPGGSAKTARSRRNERV